MSYLFSLLMILGCPPQLCLLNDLIQYFLSFARRFCMTGLGVRRAKAAFSSGCESHPAISLQPEAIGAVMEVTKWLEPPV
jgi:hypothetical protein